ncbi:hypothetical protein E3O45_08110 [Cryobacterium sp. TMS1-20-1]|uniref:hypothetical protein n=1 Tax=unclassified Cryobacterium TaxID=2649013 RepID=UPI0010693053|nr:MULTISPECIES: hypothetical protein [unclassified Cryobacterium]TFC76717.1 hypothetical protein E3O45_08110 [Cryobacterium sp. TMS1-20-1]TFD59348.1 hypothetical protein E3T43_04365 [Cryobacterium sp. Hh7]
MSRRKIWGVLQRVSFGVFGILGLVFFPLAVAGVLEDLGSRIVPVRTASTYWSQVGLPTPGEGRTAIQTAVGTLLGSFVLALVAIVPRTMWDMRRRINGVVLGSNILSATRRLDSAAEVAEALCHATASAVGVVTRTERRSGQGHPLAAIHSTV